MMHKKPNKYFMSIFSTHENNNFKNFNNIIYNQKLEIKFCNSLGYVASGNCRLHQASD